MIITAIASIITAIASIIASRFAAIAWIGVAAISNILDWLRTSTSDPGVVCNNSPLFFECNGLNCICQSCGWLSAEGNINQKHIPPGRLLMPDALHNEPLRLDMPAVLSRSLLGNTKPGWLLVILQQRDLRSPKDEIGLCAKAHRPSHCASKR